MPEEEQAVEPEAAEPEVAEPDDLGPEYMDDEEAPEPPGEEAPADEEPATEEAPAEEQPEDARLARAWEDYVQRDGQLLTRQTELAEKERQMADLIKVRELASNDPLAAMKAAGIDPHAALSAMWGDDMLPEGTKKDEVPVPAWVQEKLTAQETQLRELQERNVQTEQRALLQQKQGAIAQAAGANKELELVQSAINNPEVSQEFLAQLVQVADSLDLGPGQRPDLASILQNAEDELYAAYEKSINSVKGIGKIQKLLSGNGESKPATPKAKQQPPTLSAEMSREVTETAKRPATVEEARAEAEKFIVWDDE